MQSANSFCFPVIFSCEGSCYKAQCLYKEDTPAPTPPQISALVHSPLTVPLTNPLGQSSVHLAWYHRLLTVSRISHCMTSLCFPYISHPSRHETAYLKHIREQLWTCLTAGLEVQHSLAQSINTSNCNFEGNTVHMHVTMTHQLQPVLSSHVLQ